MCCYAPGDYMRWIEHNCLFYFRFTAQNPFFYLAHMNKERERKNDGKKTEQSLLQDEKHVRFALVFRVSRSSRAAASSNTNKSARSKTDKEPRVGCVMENAKGGSASFNHVIRGPCVWVWCAAAHRTQIQKSHRNSLIYSDLLFLRPVKQLCCSSVHYVVVSGRDESIYFKQQPNRLGTVAFVALDRNSPLPRTKKQQRQMWMVIEQCSLFLAIFTWYLQMHFIHLYIEL